MPAFELTPRFERCQWDWRKLTAQHRNAFRKTVREAFIPDLDTPDQPFRPGLRVKGVTAHPGVFEMTWAPDGRATFSYGEERIAGKAHVIWRRTGTHSIFTRLQGPDIRRDADLPPRRAPSGLPAATRQTNLHYAQ